MSGGASPFISDGRVLSVTLRTLSGQCAEVRNSALPPLAGTRHGFQLITDLGGEICQVTYIIPLPRAQSPDTQVRTNYLPCLRRSPFSPTCRYRVTGLIGSEVTRRAAIAQGCVRGRRRRGEGLRARQRNAGERKHGGIDGCSTTLGLVCLAGRPGAALCQRTPFFCI